VTAAPLRRVLRRASCVGVRQRGSHLIVACGTCQTVVPIHRGELGLGLLRAIGRQLAPCLGADWLKSRRSTRRGPNVTRPAIGPARCRPYPALSARPAPCRPSATAWPEAIALVLDLPDGAKDCITVEVEPVLPAAVRPTVQNARNHRARAATANAQADQATNEAIATLRGAGLSLRDVGSIVGLSHQRVDQREAS
jgi:predicted RNA binding protein YcfA (HicA-like mRNA interferase family)